MFTIPENAVTATIHTDDATQPFYAIPFRMSPVKTHIPKGTTLMVLGRDESGDWLEGVVILDKSLVHGWISAQATRNIMAEGRLIKPEALPTSNYAYNSVREMYDATRYQKTLRGYAGIRVYFRFMLIFALITTAIGGVAGVLFIQESSDIISKFLIGAGIGGAIGFGIGWIPAFVPMARDEKFQLADARFKALEHIRRAKKRDVTPLESQADLEKATTAMAGRVK
ncbi:MAG: hypothetical protein SFZ02_16425 [bacterium]|nr:hypothetical protein [bacterium]